jgi:D-3-phosphoglycerate dehydrogenase
MPAEQRRYFDTLSQSGRVLLTPHVGGWTHESYEKISRVLAQKIVALNRD